MAVPTMTTTMIAEKAVSTVAGTERASLEADMFIPVVGKTDTAVSGNSETPFGASDGIERGITLDPLPHQQVKQRAPRRVLTLCGTLTKGDDVPTYDSAAEFLKSIRSLHAEVRRHLVDVYAGVKEKFDRHQREITKKWVAKQQKISTVVDQAYLLEGKFESCCPFFVARKDVKFAFKPAREVIDSQIIRSAESSHARSMKETCTICLEDTDVEQIFVVDTCLHRYCFSCMKQHVEVKLLHGMGVRCPYEGCNTELDIRRFRKFLSPQLVDLMSRQTQEALVPVGERFYCPYPLCSVLMSINEIPMHANGVSIGANPFLTRECNKCQRPFCIDCHIPWHRNMSCSDYKRLNPCHVEDTKLKSLATRKKWRQCTKCKNMIELFEGCNHISCRVGMRLLVNEVVSEEDEAAGVCPRKSRHYPANDGLNERAKENEVDRHFWCDVFRDMIVEHEARKIVVGEISFDEIADEDEMIVGIEVIKCVLLGTWDVSEELNKLRATNEALKKELAKEKNASYAAVLIVACTESQVRKYKELSDDHWRDLCAARLGWAKDKIGRDKVVRKDKSMYLKFLPFLLGGIRQNTPKVTKDLRELTLYLEAGIDSKRGLKEAYLQILENQGIFPDPDNISHMATRARNLHSLKDKEVSARVGVSMIHI
ncbi:hypothetical protein GIB67_002141 [Kingdonia uniflora]|uniref:RBR-type E3 ubiquitin transferase n=1 Tax=Kingdonia uniflora TaxID=39325 RepID=A0A7J7KWJ7_9MAGN|nr:hypothetical protein GIB67_002141 [Kingdonia uniflora]